MITITENVFRLAAGEILTGLRVTFGGQNRQQRLPAQLIVLRTSLRTTLLLLRLPGAGKYDYQEGRERGAGEKEEGLREGGREGRGGRAEKERETGSSSAVFV